MPIRYFTFVVAFFLPSLLWGGEFVDSILSVPLQKKTPFALSLKAESGAIFKTNDFVRNEDITDYSSFALKFCRTSSGDGWEDYAYGMPYFGFGLYTATFDDERLGNPVSFYLVQGAKIFSIAPKLSFNYEFNLGYSTNWNYYDRFENPDNIAVSTSENIHVGANLYFNVKPLPHFDANIGFAITHFSNGATRLPNKGMNLASPYIEISYNIHPVGQRHTTAKGYLTPPKVDKRIDHDLLLTFSSRQIYHSMNGTGLSSEYVDYNFRVLGLSYAPMFVSSHAFKWGPSLDVVYDESGGATAMRQRWEADGQYYDHMKLGDVKQRLGIGLSAKGEIVMPYFSFFANVGYNIYHGNSYDKRLYQILGVKLHFYKNFFGTFGIRSTYFSKAQFIFWSAGYTIKGKPFRKRSN